MKKKKLFKITNSAYFDVIAVAPKGEGWEELQK